ncbi:MAG: hypothetical protein IPJ23_06070 [Ignavibacteriales bacterium]|nr:hypothetical protein [Ignavibacteriales bacterium]
MNHKWIFHIILFLTFLLKNIFSQVNVPYSLDCEKSIEFLQKNCYYCGERYDGGRCFVEKFNYLGEAKDKQYYYGVYKLDDRDFPQLYKLHWQKFFIIYEGDKNQSNLKPIHFTKSKWEDDVSHYDCEMAETKYGTIIHIHLVDQAPGLDEGEYIINRKGKWERVRVPDWYCASEGLLPEGYYLDYYTSDNYIKIDLKTFTIKFPVVEEFRRDKIIGSTYFKLVVEKSRFKIIKSEYVPNSQIHRSESDAVMDTFSYCEKTIKYLQNNCYACDDSLKDVDCKIKEFKYVGIVNGKQYYFGLYAHKDDYNGQYYNKYFIIYEGKKNRNYLKPIHFFYPKDFIEFYDVDMTNTKYGLIIHIYVSDGNGGDDNGEYILYRKGRWKKLKIPNWDCVYEWVKPEDYWFCRGRTIDLKNMTITLPVYSHDDACCCPTKGIVKSKLTIDDSGFKILSSKYYPDLEE